MKIAFVYDRVLKFGGAERVLLALHEIWPKATLYTAVSDKTKAKWASVFRINSSFLDKFGLPANFHESLPLVTPYAFEQHQFEKYDIVLSITSSDAKCIVTKPYTAHICYCLTPTRYLWNSYWQYYDEPGFGYLNGLIRFLMKTSVTRLRCWDVVLSNRPDYFISISETVQKRIWKYYKRSSSIIYPPVDCKAFRIGERKPLDNYFLIVSRLVPYKKLDYAIAAFNKLKYPLKIIGTGIDEKRLREISSSNIEFVGGDLTDKNLCWYYQNCRGLIFPGEEDFGITSVEAQACGKAVVAYKKGGVQESIVAEKTGIFYEKQDEQHLIGAIKKFNMVRFDAKACRLNALRFSKTVFKKRMKSQIENIWHNHKKL